VNSAYLSENGGTPRSQKSLIAPFERRLEESKLESSTEAVQIGAKMQSVDFQALRPGNDLMPHPSDLDTGRRRVDTEARESCCWKQNDFTSHAEEFC